MDIRWSLNHNSSVLINNKLFLPLSHRTSELNTSSLLILLLRHKNQIHLKLKLSKHLPRVSKPREIIFNLNKMLQFQT